MQGKKLKPNSTISTKAIKANKINKKSKIDNIVKRGKYNSISNDTRNHIINMYCKGEYKLKEIANTFKTTIPTVQSIIKKYNSTGKIYKDDVRGHRKQKITDEIRQYIKQIIASNAIYTLTEMAKQVIILVLLFALQQCTI